VCYTEARSSAEHLAELRHQGFRIAENVAGIPTARIQAHLDLRCEQ
jgi:aminobenzoyl-glutamate utilization protein B